MMELPQRKCTFQDIDVVRIVVEHKIENKRLNVRFRRPVVNSLGDRHVAVPKGRSRKVVDVVE